MAKKQNKIDFSSGMAALTTAKLASASINYGDAALTPLVDYFTNRMALAETTSANFLSSMPDDFSAEIVPEEARGLLTEWMMNQKQQMRMLSKQLGKLGHKKTSAQYIALEKEFNVLKNSFALVNNSLTSLANYRDKGISAIKQGLAHGQDPAHVNALLEFVGKEGYKRIQFRNDGVYYKDLKGQEFNVNDLVDVKSRSNELHGALIQLNSAAQKLGLQGLDLQIDENGNATGANALEVQNGVAALLQDQDFAKDLFLGGIAGDYSGSSKIVDYYMAEQIALGAPGYEGIEVKDGKAVAAGDSYNLKILELAQNPPIDYIQQFVLKSIIDQSNSEGYSKYLSERRRTNPDKDEKTYFIGGSWLPREAAEKVDDDVAILNKDEDFPEQAGWNGFKYRRVKGKYQYYDGTWIKSDRAPIILNLGLSKREGIKDFEKAPAPTGPVPNNPVFSTPNNPLEVDKDK